MEFMNHCSTEWAVFLLSLKKFVETGEGEPAAHDVKVRDWHWAWFAEIRSGDRHGVLPKWLMRAPPSFRIAPNALCGQALRMVAEVNSGVKDMRKGGGTTHES